MVRQTWKEMAIFGKRNLAETAGGAPERDRLAQALRDMKAACDGERRQRRQIAESGARQLSRAQAVLREAEARQRDAEAALRRARRMAAVGWMAAEACRDMTALHAVATKALTSSRERLQGDHRAVNEIDWALGGLNQAEQMLDRVAAYLDARRETAQGAHIDGLLARG
ncbi:hypothetical protein [Caulobacter sp. BK020]|uniref:hypothetical protein n=1 Tax=Caulobacter sp. BK020 TaxID=2512117 RepID=UPI0010E63E3B|nr:hypothetical protein [Caulobacter sp. BK020]TCS16134.1 hypothetical protein EV278_104310 [Caulobacter sp. BK020]